MVHHGNTIISSGSPLVEFALQRQTADRATQFEKKKREKKRKHTGAKKKQVARDDKKDEQCPPVG